MCNCKTNVNGALLLSASYPRPLPPPAFEAFDNVSVTALLILSPMASTGSSVAVALEQPCTPEQVTYKGWPAVGWLLF